MKQREVADKLDCSRVTYAQYEQGRNEIASTDLPRLARILRTTVAYFFGEESALGPADNMPIALQQALGYADELAPSDQLLLFQLWKSQASAHAGIADLRRKAERELQEREVALQSGREAHTK